VSYMNMVVSNTHSILEIMMLKQIHSNTTVTKVHEQMGGTKRNACMSLFFLALMIIITLNV
jgi:hypothetical protein